MVSQSSLKNSPSSKKYHYNYKHAFPFYNKPDGRHVGFSLLYKQTTRGLADVLGCFLRCDKMFWPKAMRRGEERVIWLNTLFTDHHKGESGQELTAGTYRQELKLRPRKKHGSLPCSSWIGCSACSCFPSLPGPPAEGDTTSRGWALPHQLLIKQNASQTCLQVIWWR